MRDKFELYDELAQEIQHETGVGLSSPDLVNLAIASTNHWVLFKPMIDVRKLLHYVVRGEHDMVKAILKDDASLIYKRGKVTDCSGRIFDNVSGFEYALWALDKHMWAMMMACIPPSRESKIVFTKLIAQYDKMNTDGVTYRLHGKTITEQHFDFENTIIKELQTQLDSINALGDKKWEFPNKAWAPIDKHWRENVGGAQKLLPMHVVHEYCSDELFFPVPKFTSRPNSSKQLHAWTTDNDKYWFSPDSELGVSFGIFKEKDGGCLPGIASPSGGLVRRNLVAIKALYNVRLEDFTNLKYQLEKQSAVEKQLPAFQA
ncbi:F-box protein [Legionella pneumophila serogroup 1]|uniref:hypothetical protein n=1 Tax=Legionella pneumophila TaxID=446 RepID=UPI000777E166|nr:hypothetical protein [Legionella pneumophila]HAU1410281.1 F-box protein [Legionella pneumophila]HCC3170261.1 F-box protein [Legionella pneumophila]HCC3179491.1 F-box protein [Legionella pneumophila]HCC3185441.1 F-box protein [Legionella pneumophila]HCC3188603.1 F-box protein [Legionella pneumophila]